jgi:hypothetical protein
MWRVWKDTSCIDGECGYFGMVPDVQMGFCGCFFLESANDLFLGVEPPGHHVPQCVQCGMTL